MKSLLINYLENDDLVPQFKRPVRKGSMGAEKTFQLGRDFAPSVSLCQQILFCLSTDIRNVPILTTLEMTPFRNK